MSETFTGNKEAALLFIAGQQDADKLWDISEHKEKKKRSLESNSYFWILVNKIAEHQKISDTEVHDRFLSENICYFYNEEGAFDWKTSPRIPNKYGLIRELAAEGYNYWLFAGYKVKLQKEDGTVCKDPQGNEITSNVYWHIKGSHQMDTRQMGRLIESVVYEAKNLGIETATPEQIEEMQRLWESRYGKEQKDKGL